MSSPNSIELVENRYNHNRAFTNESSFNINNPEWVDMPLNE